MGTANDVFVTKSMHSIGAGSRLSSFAVSKLCSLPARLDDQPAQPSGCAGTASSVGQEGTDSCAHVDSPSSRHKIRIRRKTGLHFTVEFNCGASANRRPGLPWVLWYTVFIWNRDRSYVFNSSGVDSV